MFLFFFSSRRRHTRLQGDWSSDVCSSDLSRCSPNSSRSPESTLNGVPASATSSPMMNTAGSRRSSSASASLIAWANVISRVAAAVTLGVNILGHLARVGVRSVEREGEALFDRCARLLPDTHQVSGRDELLIYEPRGQDDERVALFAPNLLLLFAAVVGAVDVADVVPVIAVGVRDQEPGPLAGAGTLDELSGGRVDRANVLPVHRSCLDPERARSGENLARSRLEVMRVLVVEVVLADVDHGERPERGQVHYLVDDALSERALTEEADSDLVGAAAAGRKCRAGGDPGGSADDRVRAEVAVLVVGDVHRATFAPAVAGLLAEQL